MAAPKQPGIGHNSAAGEAVAPAKLRSFIERVERLEGEKANLADDIREVYAEAKGEGFDTKTMRRIVQLRKMEQHERRERAEILAIYAEALGLDDILA